ncbi:SDR family NAD(P)-dependent oxidoreductase [Streptomyces mirabilis]|uniref:SDR family NAD(P)-dependent oxidoreductase n=1 Tax=Streptomyces mirabilis TaxID=68239 RepID=UPI0033CE9416
MLELDGKTALITGGSRGLGAVIATTLAEAGASVAITYQSSEAKAAAVVEAIEAHGGRAIAIQNDQSATSQATSLVDAVVDHFGGLDILVNNAAITVQGQRVDDPELDIEALDRQWDTNVLGVIATTRAAALRISNGGRIVFIGSVIASRVAFPGIADYAGTKAAMAGYAKGVARDLGPRNITVNVVQPGIMPTDMAAQVAERNGSDETMNLHAIHRIASTEEVAATVKYLAGPDAGYISGSVIDIAGGFQI